MAIEYTIDFECSVKQKLTVETMILMIKHRKSAENIIRAEMQGGKTEQQARENTVTLHRVDSAGNDVSFDTTVGDIIDGSAPLVALAGNCQNCPASLGSEFGCYGAINYPVSARSEQWLIGLAAQAMDKKTLGMMAIEFIMDKKFSGAPFVKMRENPNFFESRKPAILMAGKGLFGKKTVTSDQLLQFLLPSKLTEGSHMQVMSFLSGGLRIQKEPPSKETADGAFRTKDKDGSDKWFVFFLPLSEEDDPSIRQWKRYFRAVFGAHALDKTVSLDY
jgi:hypothetical protein